MRGSLAAKPSFPHPHLLLIAAVAGLVACSGGGGGARVPHPSASPSLAATSGTTRSVSLRLKIPKPATLQALARGRKRTPKWISASTEGAAITIVVNASEETVDFNLTPGSGPTPPPDGYGSATCATASDGSTTCTMIVPFSALGNNLAVRVQLYDTTPPFSAANEVASGTVATTIPLTEGANIVVPAVLSGVVSSLQAGNVVAISAAGGTGSFLLQGLDADGNIILASDGAAGPNDSPATFNVSVPPSIAGVTLSDQTTTTAGSGVMTLESANIGDTIAVSVSGTPAFVGVPLDTTIEDGLPADLGNVYAPVATAAAAPVSVAVISPPLRIAGATFEGSFNGPQANGFVVASLGAPAFYPPTVASYTVSGGSSPSGSQAGSYELDEAYDDDQITDLVTLGNANFTTPTSGLYFAGNFGSGDALAFEPLNGSTNNGSENISTQETTSSDAGAGNSATFTASEDAGGFVGSALDVFNTTYVSIAQEVSGHSAPGANPVLISGSSAPISIAATIDGGSTALGGENPLFVALTASDLYVVTPGAAGANVTVGLPIGIGTPVAIVAQGPFAFVLTSSGGIAGCPLAKNAGVGCSFAANVVANPSGDRHALALGPDGNLWIATGGGIVRYDPNDGVTTTFGSSTYDQVVASADGRLYATVVSTGEVDAIP